MKNEKISLDIDWQSLPKRERRRLKKELEKLKRVQEEKKRRFFKWGLILGTIFILASQTQTLSQGVGLLIAYALGLSIPMLFSGFLLTKLKFLKNRYIPSISGGILIVLGLLLFLNQYERLTFGIAKVYQILKIPIF